jgi:outer membrane protein assembly factor BamB
LTKGKSADHGNAAGVLRALNAETLEELWNSEANPKRDRLGTLVKFVPPLVVEGRVYVPNYDNAVVVYGVLHD